MNCRTVSDYPFSSLNSDQNCFGLGACRFEDDVLDFKCLVLARSHVKCSSKAMTAFIHTLRNMKGLGTVIISVSC